MAQFVVKGGKPGLYITDYNEIIRELNRVQPTLVKQLRTDFKEIAKPVRAEVQTSIPDAPPTSGIHKKRKTQYQSGFYPKIVPGRLTWGANSQNNMRKARSVGIQTISATKAKRNMKYNKMTQIAIARLKVDNAATVMADMAGSSGKYINSRPITREYKYSRSASGIRRHRINGQGNGMIGALGGRGSRYVYPAADRARPNTVQQTRIVLEKALVKINRRLS